MFINIKYSAVFISNGLLHRNGFFLFAYELVGCLLNVYYMFSGIFKIKHI